LAPAIKDAFRFDEVVLLEKAIDAREIEVAVLENIQPDEPPIVSIPGELKIHHTSGFYSYAAKYLESDQTELCIPAELPPEMVQKCQQLAATIFTKLECRGMARVDFFLDRQNPNHLYFNEVNTLPGFTNISMYPLMMAASGIPYPTLLDKLIDIARHHQRTKQQLIRDYQ
jgi:D-alanine-D-alanine ligase and related ATP-grasp enzymes